jgi:hypothetical protein
MVLPSLAATAPKEMLSTIKRPAGSLQGDRIAVKAGWSRPERQSVETYMSGVGFMNNPD